MGLGRWVKRISLTAMMITLGAVAFNKYWTDKPEKLEPCIAYVGPVSQGHPIDAAVFEGIREAEREFGEAEVIPTETGKPLQSVIEDKDVDFIISPANPNRLRIPDNVWVFSFTDSERMRGTPKNWISLYQNREDLYDAIAQYCKSQGLDVMLEQESLSSPLIFMDIFKGRGVDHLWIEMDSYFTKRYLGNRAAVFHDEYHMKKYKALLDDAGVEAIILENSESIVIPPEGCKVIYKVNRFGPRFSAVAKQRFGWGAPYGYDATKLILEGIRESQGDPARFKEFIYGRTHEGATGRFRFDRQGGARRDIELRELDGTSTREYKYEYLESE
ncbi:hypothetical protein JW968_05300 [Candidatus Woesearchaeota archaeon]|nr:hypothetical protein [Candidatus Woesearchaeota archaeon]